MPDAIIETEKPIGDSSKENKGRADMIINDTILLESKRKAVRHINSFNSLTNLFIKLKIIKRYLAKNQ